VDFDPGVMVAGLLVGFVVGLTGMGGGALMTPILVLLFKINPLAAVSCRGGDRPAAVCTRSPSGLAGQCSSGSSADLSWA
jgi:uncharacterized membrane protein YfcA